MPAKAIQMCAAHSTMSTETPPPTYRAIHAVRLLVLWAKLFPKVAVFFTKIARQTYVIILHENSVLVGIFGAYNKS